MVEVAFKVVKGSKFYNDYFNAKEERQKFHDLAREFLIKNGFSLNRKYLMSRRLYLELTDEEQEKYSYQLMKHKIDFGLRLFKIKSSIQNKWEEEVFNKIDYSKIENVSLWYCKYINQGAYSLWDFDGNIYGYLKNNNKDSINLSDDIEEIKTSEYYRVMEESEKGEF